MDCKRQCKIRKKIFVANKHQESDKHIQAVETFKRLLSNESVIIDKMIGSEAVSKITKGKIRSE